MKTAAIISVGTELMCGKIDDTNSTYISKWLRGCGIKVKFRLSTNDDINELVNAIKQVSSCDLIILTGGLGPTTDDITRNALAKFLKKKLVFQKNEYKKIYICKCCLTCIHPALLRLLRGKTGNCFV